MRSFSNGNGFGCGDSTFNGPAAGPYVLTISGVPLNAIPPLWAGGPPAGTL